MRQFIAKSIGCLALGLVGQSAFAAVCSDLMPTWGEVCLTTANSKMSATAKGYATAVQHGALQLAVYHCTTVSCATNQLIANSPKISDASKAPATLSTPAVRIDESKLYVGQLQYTRGKNTIVVVEVFRFPTK